MSELVPNSVFIIRRQWFSCSIAQVVLKSHASCMHNAAEDGSLSTKRIKAYV